jgi:hypothetical protein
MANRSNPITDSPSDLSFPARLAEGSSNDCRGWRLAPKKVSTMWVGHVDSYLQYHSESALQLHFWVGGPSLLHVVAGRADRSRYLCRVIRTTKSFRHKSCQNRLVRKPTGSTTRCMSHSNPLSEPVSVRYIIKFETSHSSTWDILTSSCSDLNVNSVIAKPNHNDLLLLPQGEENDATYAMQGSAYAGGGRRVARVEISLNGGDGRVDASLAVRLFISHLSYVRDTQCATLLLQYVP